MKLEYPEDTLRAQGEHECWTGIERQFWKWEAKMPTLALAIQPNTTNTTHRCRNRQAVWLTGIVPTRVWPDLSEVGGPYDFYFPPFLKAFLVQEVFLLSRSLIKSAKTFISTLWFFIWSFLYWWLIFCSCRWAHMHTLKYCTSKKTSLLYCLT